MINTGGGILVIPCVRAARLHMIYHRQGMFGCFDTGDIEPGFYNVPRFCWDFFILDMGAEYK